MSFFSSPVRILSTTLTTSITADCAGQLRGPLFGLLLYPAKQHTDQPGNNSNRRKVACRHPRNVVQIGKESAGELSRERQGHFL
jgi:hypothetical protein